MNAAGREYKIVKLKREINDIWKSLWMLSVYTLLMWFLEPMMEEIMQLGGEENKLLTTISKMFFDYILVAVFWIGYIIGLIVIFKKKRAIKRYRKTKDAPPKINIQKDDINQNPVYAIDHSKDKPNQYEKGDRDIMERVFNQNKNTFTNSGKQNTNRTRGKGSSTRSYNGSTRSSNSMPSDNSALDIALGSSIYSTGNDNDCSSSSSSNYSSSSSDYSSGSSGYDGGSSCD
ncbi:hypothetical protein [Bacillus cereus]|uniref:hypothetical protein n=1 Tax=Bacillus cereus TaxID=1396 RepID=UPI00283AAF33|nr:hypothetical protein [Bacillus cereus]